MNSKYRVFISMIIIVIFVTCLGPFNMNSVFGEEAEEDVIKYNIDENEEYKKEKNKLLYGYNVTSGKDIIEGIKKTNPIIDPESDYLSSKNCIITGDPVQNTIVEKSSSRKDSYGGTSSSTSYSTGSLSSESRKDSHSLPAP